MADTSMNTKERGPVTKNEVIDLVKERMVGYVPQRGTAISLGIEIFKLIREHGAASDELDTRGVVMNP